MNSQHIVVDISGLAPANWLAQFSHKLKTGDTASICFKETEDEFSDDS